MIRKILSILTVALLLFTFSVNAFATEYVPDETIDSLFERKDGKVLFDEEFLKGAGTTASDWYVIALSVNEIDAEYDKYLDALKVYVDEKYKEENRLHRVKATEWHRISLAVEACGGNADDFNGINLIKDGIYDFDLDKQGISAYIWGLITLSAEDYDVSANPLNTKESIIDKILGYQLSDGGFSLSGNKGDVDVTANVITALSLYKDDKEVTDCLEKAVGFIKSSQLSDGGFESYGVENCESACQALIALSVMGEDTQSIFSNIMTYKTDGGFSHLQNGEKSFFATQQVLLSYSAYITKNGFVYDFRDEVGNNEINEIKIDVSESDRELIKGFSKKVNASDIETIKRLLQTVETVKPDDEFVLKTTLEIALAKADDISERIDYFNNNVSEISKSGVSLKDKNTLNKLGVYYEEFSEEDKQLLNDYDGYVRIKVMYDTLVRKYVIMAVISTVILISVIILVVNRKKRRNDEE